VVNVLIRSVLFAKAKKVILKPFIWDVTRKKREMKKTGC